MPVTPFLYNSLISGYKSAVKIAAIFNPKAKKLNAGQKGLLRTIKKQLNTDTAPKVWFHCASLGEFEQGRPVMEAFRARHPHFRIVLTFFSPSGYEVRKNYAGADYIFYLPYDTTSNAIAFISAVKPSLAFFVKYEFWYNYLHQLYRQQVPTFLISGIFRPGQLFFKKQGGFNRQMLSFFQHLFVQNEESAQLLKSVGINNFSICGDTRFDRVAEVCREPKKVPIAEAFKTNQPLLVVGSSWEPDLEVITPLLQEYQGRLKCIIAPHEIDAAQLNNIEQILAGLEVVRFSKADPATVAQADVLLVDNVGMLSALYALGEFAYVGGSFGKGLHNILEAATFGMPVFFGNKSYHKFQEAKDLIKEGGAFAVEDTAELQQQFSVLFSSERKRLKAAEISACYVQQHTGATRQIVEYVDKLLQE